VVGGASDALRATRHRPREGCRVPSTASTLLVFVFAAAGSRRRYRLKASDDPVPSPSSIQAPPTSHTSHVVALVAATPVEHRGERADGDDAHVEDLARRRRSRRRHAAASGPALRRVGAADAEEPVWVVIRRDAASDGDR
jgi:hypothetical protein